MILAFFCFVFGLPDAGTASDFNLLRHNPELQSGYRIKLNISNLTEVAGNVAILIFNAREGFPGDEKKAIRKAVLKVTDRVILHEFDRLPPGNYAVAVVHDKNGNSRLDTNFLGIPNEGVGVSNNAWNRFGPPRFEDAVFVLKDSDVSLTIRLRN